VHTHAPFTHFTHFTHWRAGSPPAALAAAHHLRSAQASRCWPPAHTGSIPFPPPPRTRARAHAGQPRKHRLACRQEAAAIHRRVEMTLSRHGRDWAALTAARRLRMVGMSAVLALHSSIRAVFPSAVTSCGWSAWHVSRQAGRHNHAPCPSFTSHGASIRQARGPPRCAVLSTATNRVHDYVLPPGCCARPDQRLPWQATLTPRPARVVLPARPAPSSIQSCLTSGLPIIVDLCTRMRKRTRSIAWANRWVRINSIARRCAHLCCAD
jgi:hypothetical protein